MVDAFLVVEERDSAPAKGEPSVEPARQRKLVAELRTQYVQGGKASCADVIVALHAAILSQRLVRYEQPVLVPQSLQV